MNMRFLTLSITTMVLTLSWDAVKSDIEERDTDNHITCDRKSNYTLRHGSKYSFFSKWENSDRRKSGLNEIMVEFIEQRDYNAGSNPKFGWTEWIKNKDYILKPSESGRVVKADRQYAIKYTPITRDADNLIINYRYIFYKQEDSGEWSGPWERRDCVHYQISWCGDGIIDKEYETCDPASPNNSSNEYCNDSCQSNTNSAM